MQLRDHFLRTFDFNARANQRIIEALQAETHPSSEAVGLLAHILSVDKIWFLRLEGFDTGPTTAWPTLTLNECVELAHITADTARGFVRHLTDDAFDHAVQYRSLKDEVFTNTIGDILLHVTHHGAHHRAQINRVLREQGMEPVKVDFIGFARE